MFVRDGDYHAFERVLSEAVTRNDMRLLAYCLMPNHWHLVLWPRENGELGPFMHWLSSTHVRRWHKSRGDKSNGHLYQGAYKSFPIESDKHLWTVCRYVERNALRAGLVHRAQDWRWSSLASPARGERSESRPVLCQWPLERPRDWLGIVNEPLTQAELTALQHSIKRGRPYGGGRWQEMSAERLGLGFTFRAPHRPPRTD